MEVYIVTVPYKYSDVCCLALLKLVPVSLFDPLVGSCMVVAVGSARTAVPSDLNVHHPIEGNAHISLAEIKI